MLPHDYAQRVYAGVLGKIIGVYLGRPFESATHDQIMRDLGVIEYYVHERRNLNLIVADDDITGMFTFLRALKHLPLRSLQEQSTLNLSYKQVFLKQSWLKNSHETTLRSTLREIQRSLLFGTCKAVNSYLEKKLKLLLQLDLFNQRLI